ncbi:MAG: DUF5788 family protein [Haloferacaceae archaeon]
MNEKRREELLARIRRQGATVGASIPETVTVGEAQLPLREFLIETRKVEGVPPDARDLVRDTTRKLNGRREELVARLETAPLEDEEAERIADEIVGIDRAINALENLRRPTYGEETAGEALADHRRWLDFLRTIQG